MKRIATLLILVIGVSAGLFAGTASAASSCNIDLMPSQGCYNYLIRYQQDPNLGFIAPSASIQARLKMVKDNCEVCQKKAEKAYKSASKSQKEKGVYYLYVDK